MLHKLKKDQAGFSIVEVMIVLGIAGLIMLVVFLAVPALQRNSRNTSVKNDASAIAAAVSTYRSSNGGSNPAASTTITQPGTTGNGALGGIEFKTSQISNVTIGSNPTSALSDGNAVVVIGVKCTTSSSTSWSDSLTATSGRSAVVIYPTEVGGTTKAKNCLDS